MTEQEWLACAHPWKILKLLRRKTSDRKVRLFACACCRRAWSQIRPSLGQKAVEVAEQYADGAVDAGVLAATRAAAIEMGRGVSWGPAFVAACWSANPGRSTVEKVASNLAKHMAVFIASARSGKRWKAAKDQESLAQATLLREILGNPFRPVTVDPDWQTPTVRALAQAAYDNRELPAGTLDPARLAVLADALEEAGCTDPTILGHLRGLGPHVRGCFAVDLLLGKR